MRKPLVLLIITVLSFAAISINYLRPHWCGAISFERVIYAEEELSESALYQCPDGTFVIWLQKDETISAVFIVEPNLYKVGKVSSSGFFNFDAGVFSLEMPIRPGFLGEVKAKNDDSNPRLELTNESIQFYPYDDDKRVLVVKTNTGR